jgi:hypothetical protein
MSKQLTLSATISTAAMLAVALGLACAVPPGGGARGATAHGSLVSVLLRA